MAYRMVGLDQERRIGICRLDKRFGIIRGTQAPFSDLVNNSGLDNETRQLRWFADPRLYRLGGRTYIYWNTGWQEPINHQFLQEFDEQTLSPQGMPRELKLEGRRPIEKNWTFFGDGPFYCVYSICPHRVLEFSLEGQGTIEFKEMPAKDVDFSEYSKTYGEARGGTPPVLVNDQYISIAHSLYSGSKGVRYVPLAYSFSSNAPFVPTAAPIAPLNLGNPFGRQTLHQRLNKAVSEVIYPSGADCVAGDFIISHGINDELCAISILPYKDIIETMKALES